MKAIKTKFGAIYVEEFDKRLEEDTIEFVDSDGKFLDRWSIEIFDDITMESVIDKLSKFETPQELMQYMNINYMLISDDIEEVYDIAIELNMFYPEDIELIKKAREKNNLTDNILLSNEWINHIGNYYIIVEEY